MINRLTFSSFILVAFFGCSSYNDIKHEPTFSADIVDTESWYDDANNNVYKMNVIIPEPNEYKCAPYDNPFGTERPCTLVDIDGDSNPSDEYKPILHVNMSTENFGIEGAVENAIFKIKGNYTRKADQKSYSIKLDSDTNLWLKQRKFLLAKQEADRSRVKNKLAFDLFRKIPNITSLKTQFIHLFINDIDYGLFTHVEAPREEYLVNRGWNKDDNLYNAENFQFNLSEALKTDEQGQVLDEEAFSTVLEIKNGEEHSLVYKMVSAINSEMPIDEVINKYFNRDNYIKWLAINLVIGNKDTTYHNFYLYNPVYSNTFYFLPWDYDGAWAKAKNLGKSEYGISVWLESPLHKKFLTIKKNADDVYKMAEEIRTKYMSDEILRGYLDGYEESVRPFVSRLPDSVHNSDSTWLGAIEDLVTGIQNNVDLYKSVIGDPMPFRQYIEYTASTSTLTFSWDESVDLEGDEIIYDLSLYDENFSDKILSVSNIATTTYTQNLLLKEGKYYLKVISQDKNNLNSYQESFDRTRVNDKTQHGVLAFFVDSNGVISYEY